MTKSVEMLKNLDSMIGECQNLIDEGRLEEAKNKKKEIDDYKALISIQEELENAERTGLRDKIDKLPPAEAKRASSGVRAILKRCLGHDLTEAENALLIPTTSSPNGENGEGYILPVDVRTTITKLVRDYGSVRDIFGYMKASALKGSFAVEAYETISELVDLDESADGKDIEDIKFSNVSYALKIKAGFISISNILLNFTDEDLLSYISSIFARKKAVTENKMLLEAAKKNKTGVAVEGYSGVKSVVNKTLDPAAALNCVYLTNQSGYDILDNEKDQMGRPILQPDPTQPTRMLLKGHPIRYVSDDILPNVSGQSVNGSPIFIGDLKSGVYFVDAESDSLNFDKSVGFMKNRTVGRIITLIDAVQTDKSDKCYVYGLLSAPAAAAMASLEENGEAGV